MMILVVSFKLVAILTDQTICLGIKLPVESSRSWSVHKKDCAIRDAYVDRKRRIYAQSRVITLFEILNKFIGLERSYKLRWSLHLSHPYFPSAYFQSLISYQREKDIGLKNHGACEERNQIVFLLTSWPATVTRPDRHVETRNQLHQAWFLVCSSQIPVHFPERIRKINPL